MSINTQASDVILLELENGMKIEVLPNSESWDGILYASNEFIEGEAGFFQFAANHLIEHSLSGPFSGVAETRSTFISFKLSKMDNVQQALSMLNSLGKDMSNISLDENTVLEQKRIIFEEWAGQALHTEQFKYFGGSFYPVSFDKKDKIIEDVSHEKIFHFMNKQADYNQDFSLDELNQQARFMFGAKNLTLRIQTPLAIDSFKHFLARTNLAQIPAEHENSAQIKARQVPDNFDYRKIVPEKSVFEFKVPNNEEKEAAFLLNNMLKMAKRESGFYWSSRQVKKEKDEVGFKIDVQITKNNKNKMINSMVQFLNQASSPNNPNEMNRQVARRLSHQLHAQLGQELNFSSFRTGR